MTAAVSFLERSSSQGDSRPESIASGGSSEDVEEAVERAKMSCRKMSLFSIYAKIFRLMLARWDETLDPNEDKHLKELDDLVLPSNEEWRRQVYYRLVDLQREIDAEGDVIE